jgi:endonuclease-3 related protein
MTGKSLKTKQIRRVFHTLEAALEQQHWWPAESAFEVVVGAYLTQNTAWTNVELAMENLRRAGILTVSGMGASGLAELEQLIRPAGYFRQKAARLLRFVAHLNAHYGGSLEAMFAQPTGALREELLGLPGIGPETADSILLYAASHEVFVVDTYTRRIFERHELAEPGAGYDEIRLAVQVALRKAKPARRQSRLPGQAQDPHRRINAASEEARREGGSPGPVPHAPSAASQMERSELAQRYNEFHALIVQTAKHFCVKGEPRCENCPLRELLPRRAR